VADVAPILRGYEWLLELVTGMSEFLIRIFYRYWFLTNTQTHSRACTHANTRTHTQLTDEITHAWTHVHFIPWQRFIYVYMYVYIDMYMHTFIIHACIYTQCIHKCIYMYIHTYMCIHV
jgi:hypothetical protein